MSLLENELLTGSLIALAGIGALLGLGWSRRAGRPDSGAPSPEKPLPSSSEELLPQVGDDATVPRDAPKRGVEDVDVLDPEFLTESQALDRPDPVDGRLVRLRGRLARSNSALGQGLLTLLSRGTLDESTWEELEATLLAADIGVGPTEELLERLRSQVKVQAVRTPEEVRAMVRAELLALLDPEIDRELAVRGSDGAPAVVLVVGVNGTGKTTTVGKLARVLVAQDREVLLGAADTFRAAAADQLETWG
ncbi:MAG: signal recognition particle receptor subunit alpha, partial [Angustibacter sp.]